MNHLLFAAFMILPAIAVADAPLRVTALQPHTNVFANESIQRTFEIKGSPNQPLSGIASWSFSARGRTLSRGELAVQVTSTRTAEFTLSLLTPPINDGLVFECELQIDVAERPGGKSLAAFTQPLHVWSPDPFYNRQQWLASLELRLFDPPQQTARIFRSAEIPFASIERVSAIKRYESGWIVIGAEVAYDEHPGLLKDLIDAAARGVNVLCLTPRATRSSLPDSGFAIPIVPSVTPIQQLRLQREEVIREFDKRFDPPPWHPSLRMAHVGMSLRPQRNQIHAQYVAIPDAWPWMEVVYGSPLATSGEAFHGRLIICGFPIIQSWDEHPTPRYLFAKLLERPASSVYPETRGNSK